MIVCFGFLRPSSRNFSSYGDDTYASEGLQILTCARHSCPLSSEGSLAHLLWHGGSVYTGHLRGPKTLTPIAERWDEVHSIKTERFWCCNWNALFDKSPYDIFIIFSGWRNLSGITRYYMAQILPIRRKILYNQSINQSISSSNTCHNL